MFKLNQQQLQALIISVLVHLCLLLLAIALPKVPLGPPTNQPVEIVYQNETGKKPKQVVEDPNSNFDDAIKDLKEEVTRLSKATHRVLREQIAAKSGETQNRSGQNGTQQATELAKAAREELTRQPHEVAKNSHKTDFAPTEMKSPDAPKANEEANEDPRYAPPSITAPMAGSNVARETHLGDSTISDYIPEVKVGGFTSLNQDQFLYYTFYARINEQIRNRWIENIRNLLNEAPRNQLSKWAEHPQISEFEVLLSPEGKYLRTILYRHADAPIVDNTAVSAIRLASPFNNPPSEIVEADGFIHLRYQFHLEFRPSLIASGSR